MCSRCLDNFKDVKVDLKVYISEVKVLRRVTSLKVKSDELGQAWPSARSSTKQITFPLLQLASSMKLNVEPVVAGYAWSNALCAVTAGLSVDSDRNRDYSLLVDYTALRPLANPLHAPARALLIHLYEAWALEKAARRNKGDTLDEWVSGAQEDRRRENLAEAIKSLSGSAQATTSSTRFRRLLSTASTGRREARPVGVQPA